MPETNPPNPNQSPQAAQRQPHFFFIPIGLIISLFITVLRLFSPAEQKAPAVDNSAISRGFNYYISGDYDMAIFMFNQILFSDPASDEAYNNLGLTYYAKADYPTALANFDKAILLQPDTATPYCNRGIVYYSLGQPDSALADLTRAIELDPTFGKAYYNRGLVYQSRAAYDLAIADYDSAIQLTPASTAALQEMGQKVQDRLGVYQMTLLSQPYPRLPEVYSNRALAYFQNGDSASALADLEQAAALGLDAQQLQQMHALFNSLQVAIQPGHWSGSTVNGPWQGTVSFAIDSEGVIHNFNMHVYFGFDTPCPLTAETISLDSENTFSFNLVDFHGSGSSLVHGKFDTLTNVSGTVDPARIECFFYPGNFIAVPLPEGVTWSAQWQGE